MRAKILLHRILTFAIACVWIINGLFCKLMNGVPRHQQIVAKVMGDEYAALLTNTIGFCELLMAAWVLSGLKSRLNAIVQILLIAAMNTIELIFARKLLLFGWMNLVLAGILIAVIYYNEFILNEKLNRLT